MAKVNWPKDYPPDKTKLINAIVQWIDIRNGGDVYHKIENLDRLTIQTLLTMALAMGYKPPAPWIEKLRQWRAEKNAYEAKRAAELHARWEREAAERKAEAEAMAKANVPKLPPSLSGL